MEVIKSGDAETARQKMQLCNRSDARPQLPTHTPARPDTRQPGQAWRPDPMKRNVRL